MNTNPELELASTLIAQTGTNIFLTGKAGTGKTTFLRSLVEKSPKRMIILAPTGIAAINAGGMTIHSFFQLPFAPYIPGTAFGGDAKYRFRFGKEKLNIMRSIDLLVIDEISMVRADLLDAIDDVLRRFRRNSKPFGGVQLLLIGDIQQLPPVAKSDEWQMLSEYYDSPYFFSSHALRETSFCTIELKQVYRQSDARFLSLLNAIRENRCTNEIINTLNSRYIPRINPGDDEGYIRLTTHNIQAQRINQKKLDELPSRSYRFKATVEGDFPDYSYPTELELELKKGAQVMFVKNDISGMHRYANGTIGRITNISNEGIEVMVNETGMRVSLEEAEWANAKYRLDEETKEIVKKCKTLESIRVYSLYIAFEQKSKSEIKYAVNKARKMYDRLTVGEIAKEIALMAETIKKIIDFDDELVDEQVLKDACYEKTESNVYKELVDYQLSLKKTINKKEETEEENKEIKD